MSTSEPPQPKDPQAAWLAELAGRQRTQNAEPDTRVASMLGRLIRARFHEQLRAARDEPDSDMTRARILAHARATQAQRRSWRVPIAWSSGLAAGIIGALFWVQIRAPAEFGDVTRTETLANADDTKGLDLLSVQRYLIHSRDVAGTAAELTAHLLRGHANLRVESRPAGSMQINVDRVPALTEDLAQAAARLGVTFKSGTALQITIQPP